jgi:hypothetical protein
MEWKPAVDWMWLLKAGANGHYNPRLISAADWAAFQKTWSDLAAGRIEVPA